MAAVTGKAARIAVTAATATSSTNNAADLSTDGVTLPITSTGRRHWPNNTTSLVVAIGGTPTTDAYLANYVQGIVTFTTPHSTAAAYTIDVEYLTSSFVGSGKQWTATVANDLREQTAFSTTTDDVQWRTFAPGLAGGTISIDRFVASTTGPAFFDRLAGGTEVLVELWQDHTSRNKLEGFAYVDGDGFDVTVDGDADETVSLTLNGQLYLSTQ